MKRLSNILVLGSLVASAIMGGFMFVGRFLHLTNGFQYDELYSVATATPAVGWSTIWHDMLLRDINLPLFNILFFGWNHLFPITPVYAHLLSALLGALAVVAAFFLAPKTWPKLQKFIFVMLMSGSFILVIYGTNVRSYSLSVLLSTCFTLLALRLIEHLRQADKISGGLWLSFFVTGFLGAYSHYFCAAVFFIAALVVFVYACRYRRGRAWSFWGTAVVFFAWIPWVLAALGVMGMVGGVSSTQTGAVDWWYHTPFLLATWEVLVFLFGPSYFLRALGLFSILAGVSLWSTKGKQLVKIPEVILPIAQVVLLCAVVGLVSFRFNLWMDRYFLPVLPSIFVLMAYALYHLQQRHRELIVLLPVLLFGWMSLYWNSGYVWAQEYTGLKGAITYLSTYPNGARKVLFEKTNADYSSQALEVMLHYYLPPGSEVELIPLSQETVQLALQGEPKAPIMVMLCSKVSLLRTIIPMHLEEDHKPFIFGNDTCVFTAHEFTPVSQLEKTEKELL